MLRRTYHPKVSRYPAKLLRSKDKTPTRKKRRKKLNACVVATQAFQHDPFCLLAVDVVSELVKKRSWKKRGSWRRRGPPATFTLSQTKVPLVSSTQGLAPASSFFSLKTSFLACRSHAFRSLFQSFSRNRIFGCPNLNLPNKTPH